MGHAQARKTKRFFSFWVAPLQAKPIFVSGRIGFQQCVELRDLNDQVTAKPNCAIKFHQDNFMLLLVFVGVPPCLSDSHVPHIDTNRNFGPYNVHGILANRLFLTCC